MKKLLCILSLLMLSGLAFGGTNVPPCDPNNPPPNCTDYFGVANWAQSPLPAGAITGFTIKAAGSGYSATTVAVITDATGTGATAPTFTMNATGGLATVIGTGGGANYIAPQITVVDFGPGGTAALPTCGGLGQVACGSGAVVLATIGAPLTPGTGMRKFVDTLTTNLPSGVVANLQIATPDPLTFPGSDFYVIGLVQYTTKMHADLPPTTLRGYCQLAAPSYTACVAGQPSYLGPTILASKNTPVRVLFKNMLPIGTGGNLFIPVDTTYMGAGLDMSGGTLASYTENRATLHLHGGATPWISDGTPHQWTVPNLEAGGPARGDSVQFVPDMWFDPSTHALVPAGTAGAINDPGPGNLTFFWTNQQGARLMFYHDHAYGITRLNVYAGEAAGYLLTDSVEDTGLAAATVPTDVAHLVPLVIQDKTFVPSAAQLAVEDPTWTAGGFGTTPGAANPGDLWFPHVYTTNQNPADPGGANGFGRWDYGPWTLPGNQTVLLAANPETAVTIPCTSSAFPNQAVQCPIIPNPSGTPEGFMDTPLVNGKAYPVLHVAPEAYRFRLLSAGNDRSLNLSWYIADPTVTTVDGRLNTEVKMLPAVQPSGAVGTLPLCTQITPITNTTLFMGLATGLLDASGNPINGTGLPAGCWPNFGAGSQAAGIPIQQTMWAADGRVGGAPDPTMAGPPWIEIGTEGGLLPAPVVIPSMPIGYEANTRSVTITNVSVHGLWLGPAERADAVVDFSKFAGKTLILYNDAPTPAPAIDSRLDYFTDDGDQTPIGGAPNTIAGFGPNTRTIMQVVVDQAPTAGMTPFSLAALQTAQPGIFAQTQPQIIVPEPTYPPASGGYSPILTYSLISDGTLTWFPVGSTTSVTYTDERKTIQELFTLDYGRMNATLGVELPLTNFLTQTTIPLGYIDPPTEIIDPNKIQLWHITHNGVDTHFIHFHLFNVQVINRSAWDGTKRPPDQNELGWKDTVRMNPLEDILVALQPIQPIPPFPVVDSYRLLDVTMPAGSDCPAPVAGPSPLPCSIFTDVNPANNNPLNTPNKVQNFGWEYVWHCHILGHEENDMMRGIAFNVPPEAPSSLAVVAATTGLNLTWTDNSSSETGFTLQRDVTAAFANPTSIPVGPSTPMDANGQGTTWGGTITYNDTAATGAGPYFYRVQALKPHADYWGPGGLVTSTWSNTAAFGGTSVFPTALAFGTVPVTTTSAAQTVTLTAGTALTYTLAISPAGQFAVPVGGDTCGGTATAGATCTISVTFAPTVGGAQAANLTITTTDPANPVLTVSLTGTGGTTLPLLTITASSTTMKYGSAVPGITFSYNPPNPVGVTGLTCSATVPATPPAIPVGPYPTNCTGAVGNYTFAYVPGTLTVTPVPLTIWGPIASLSVGSAIPTNFPPTPTDYVGFVAGDTSGSLTVQPSCTTTATSTSPIGKYPITCTGAVDPNYTISYVPGTLNITQGTLTITAPSPSMTYGGVVPVLTPTYNPINPVGLTTPATCTTTATSASPAGTYPVTCIGAVDPNYAISYVAGTLTVNPAPLTITANNATKTYGTVLTFLGTEFTATGLLNGDTATSVTLTSTGAVATAAAGPYPITPSAAVGTGLTNYTINYVNGTLTVTPALASVTPNAATKVYGTADPAFTGTLIGFLPADLVTATYSRTAGQNVGTYTISATLSPAAVLSNYTITYNTANFTITPLAASVTPNAASKVYGAADPAFTGTLTGFLPADGVTATYTRTAGETVAGSPYTISATLAPAAVLSNYAITYNTASFTITKATTTPTITSHTPSPSIVGQIVTVGVSVAPQFTGAPTGTVTVTASTGQTCTLTLPGTCTLTFPASGKPTLTASYPGDSNFLPSTSVAVTQVVSQVSLSASSLLFGNQLVGTTSAAQAVTLANVGTTPLAIISIAYNGPFRDSTNCPIGGNLAAGRSCTFNVRFAPVAPGVATGSVVVTTSDAASPATITLTGTGTLPPLNLTPVSWNYGGVTSGTTSAPQTFTLTNGTAAPVTVSRVMLNGANPGQFAITGTTCITTLPVGGTCTITVVFSPTAPGAYTANVTIRDNVNGPSPSSALSGTGL